MKNRTIKFRVWNSKMESYNTHEDMINRWWDYEEIACNSNSWYTIEQFTGLKDKNGVDIYEGDIVKGDFGLENNEIITGYIAWSNKNARYVFKGKYMQYITSMNELEVIGNIHENADLLQKD